MGKVYAQHTVGWSYSGSVDALTGITSGSIPCRGYSRLIGGVWSSCTLTTGSGFMVEQSFDGGVNYNIVQKWPSGAASTASTYDIEVVGDFIKITASPAADSVDDFRAQFYLQPVATGTVALKSSTSAIGTLGPNAGVNVGLVTVGTGTCMMGKVQVGTGACVMGLVQIASGASDAGIVHVGAGGSDIGITHIGTGACSIGSITSVEGQVSASISGGSVAMLAGENHIGEVGGRTTVVSACVTRPNDSASYVTGDMWANATTNGTLLRFPNCARKDNGSGVIVQVLCANSASLATQPQINLWLFDNVVTSPSDNAPFALTDVDIERTLGITELSTWFAGGSTLNSLAQVRNVDIPFVCQSACNSLWGIPVVMNSCSPAAQQNLQFRLGILPD